MPQCCHNKCCHNNVIKNAIKPHHQFNNHLNHDLNHNLATIYFMNLTELKRKSIAELLTIAQDMGLDNMARSRAQDIIFAILKTHQRTLNAILPYSKLKKSTLTPLTAHVIS